MAKEHVEAVFGPQWVQDSLDDVRRQLINAERVVVNLRTLLRKHDPTLPHPHDGTAWQELERG